MKLNKYVERFLSGDDPKLVIKLSDLFGFDVPNNSQFRQAVGQAVIDLIRERTADKKSWDGKTFRSYSDAYADSLEFKAYGKSKNEPNLKQTGGMLNFMDIIDEDQDSITIGWSDGDEAAKAHGHITGNVGVKRDFFGVTTKELEGIKEDFDDFIPETDTVSGFTSSVERAEAFLTGGTTIGETATLDQILQQFFGED